MKTRLNLFLGTGLALLSAGLLTGCAGTRPIGAAVLGAGGALAGHELSGGNPVATAAGAAGGVLLSEGVHYLSRRQTAKAYASGYEQGRSDAVKQQYWLYVRLQKERSPQGQVRLYPVTLPATEVDGVLLEPRVRQLRIQE